MLMLRSDWQSCTICVIYEDINYIKKGVLLQCPPQHYCWCPAGRPPVCELFVAIMFL